MKKRWITVLNLIKLGEAERIAKAKEIVESMTESTHFPDPPGPDPTLADLETQADVTEEAYIASRDAGTVETATFHNELDELERMMLKEVNYVEDVANDNPDIGDEIILSAAMEFRATGEINIQNMSVRNTRVKGSIAARMKAQRARTIYLWELRIKGDPDWIRVKTTQQARYTYTGLTSATAYEFRGGYQLADNKEIFFDPIKLVVL